MDQDGWEHEQYQDKVSRKRQDLLITEQDESSGMEEELVYDYLTIYTVSENGNDIRLAR